MGSCSECSGYGGSCPMCQEADCNCEQCGCGVKIEIEKGVFQCDSCGDTDVYYDEDLIYDERRERNL